MGELREEIGMKKHLRMKEAGSRLRWTGHTQRMSEESDKDSMEDGRR